MKSENLKASIYRYFGVGMTQLRKTKLTEAHGNGYFFSTSGLARSAREGLDRGIESHHLATPGMMSRLGGGWALNRDVS